METNRGQNGHIVIPVITAAICAFLAFGVMVLFHACGPKDDGSWMSCHYAQLTVFGIALGMTALTAAAIFAKGKLKVLLYILTIACAVAAAVIPGNVIHLCMMNEMRCRAVMRPTVILLGVVIAVLSLLDIFTAVNAEKKHRTGR